MSQEGDSRWQILEVLAHGIGLFCFLLGGIIFLATDLFPSSSDGPMVLALFLCWVWPLLAGSLFIRQMEGCLKYVAAFLWLIVILLVTGVLGSLLLEAETWQSPMETETAPRQQ